MSLNSIFKGAFPVVIGVLIAGILMNFGDDLPIIGEAADGFDR